MGKAWKRRWLATQIEAANTKIDTMIENVSNIKAATTATTNTTTTGTTTTGITDTKTTTTKKTTKTKAKKGTTDAS